MGFVYIQVIYYLLWDALLGVWTWLCMLQGKFVKGLVVSGSSLEHIRLTLTFWNSLPQYFGLLRANWQN